MKAFLISFLFIILSSLLFGQYNKGYVLHSDYKTNYSVRFDSSIKKIQVGSFEEQIEYIILKDSVIGHIRNNKTLSKSELLSNAVYPKIRNTS